MPVLPIGLVQNWNVRIIGEVSDYTRKGGVVLEKYVFSPNRLREKFKDRETLWNEVE